MKIKKYLKKKNQLRYCKFLVYSKTYNYFRNIVQRNINQAFWFKNIDERRNYFFEEIEQNRFIIRKHKKVYTTLQL